MAGMIQEMEDMDLRDKLNSENPKEAQGALKAPMNACPNTALIELYAVMAGGAHKYGLYNFRDTEISAQTYIGAIRRHMYLWEDGVDDDEESGRSHLAHIMACCALALDATHTGKLVDDRSKTGLVEGILKDCAETHNIYTKENKSIQEKLEEAEDAAFGGSTGLPELPELPELTQETIDEITKVLEKRMFTLPSDVPVPIPVFPFDSPWPGYPPERYPGKGIYVDSIIPVTSENYKLDVE